jgi:ferric-dicitrate binding protein FerR (iron transport regulator)
MSRARRLNLLCQLFLIALACCSSQSRGCMGCGQPAVLATLFELRGGSLQRQHQPDADGPANQWENAGPGTEFQTGDAVRTDSHASAKLRLPDGSELTLAPASQVRFLPKVDNDEQNIDLVTGEAVITAGRDEVRLRTHVGVATVSAGGSLRLTRAASALQLHLQVGEASFRQLTEKTPQKLVRGERVQVAIGTAIIRMSQDELADPQPSEAGVLHLNTPSGAGANLRPPGATDTTPLAAGDSTVRPDTDLYLPQGQSSTLLRDLDKVQLFGEGDYRIGHGEPLVSVQRGSLQVDARSHDVHIAVPGGWIVSKAVRSGTGYAIRVGEHEGSVSVTRGEATWSSGSEHNTIAAGQDFRWKIDAQTPIPKRPPVRAANLAGATTAVQPTAAASAQVGTKSTLPDTTTNTSTTNSNEPQQPDATPPAKVSFTVRAGESFVVHAPELPVAVGVEITGKCTGEGVIELSDGTRYRGTGKVNLWLTHGTRNYAVRCTTATLKGSALGRVSSRGTMQALRDAGTRDLPPRAPTSKVDTDGRSYTIYYQNQLPDIHARWPNAPPAQSYRLQVDKSAFTIAKPEYIFTSGRLRDGLHRLTFSAKERSSRTTTVEVRFDNTTTTASLNAPADRSFAAAHSVAIDGVALPAWKVSVDGGTIENTEDGRFHGSIVTSENQPDFAVRIAHARLGTHYYVRRAARSP